MVDAAYERTKQILIENKDKLSLLAEKLLEKEVIFRDDLELIFGKSKFEEELKEEKKVSKKIAPSKNGKAEVEEKITEEETSTDSKKGNSETEEKPKEDKNQ